MKLTRDQAYAILEKINPVLNISNSKRCRDNKTANIGFANDALDKFKKTPEYKAVLLLSKSFPGSVRCDKDKLQELANKLFNVKYLPVHYSASDEVNTILLLAVDCKTLKDLGESIRKHYGIRKNVSNLLA